MVDDRGTDNVEKLYISYDKCIYRGNEIIVYIDCYRDIEMENLRKEIIEKIGCLAFW